MWPLEHNSEICFVCLNKKVLVFMSLEATSDSFPPDLTTKYQGDCEKVRLGFRVPILHRVEIKIIGHSYFSYFS